MSAPTHRSISALATLISAVMAPACNSAIIEDPVVLYEPVARPKGDGYEPRRIDVQRYELDFVFSRTATTVEAEARISFDVTDELNELKLDFGGFIIDSVELDGGPQTWTREDSEAGARPLPLLRVATGPLAVGARYTLTVRYHGVPSTKRVDVFGENAFTAGFHGFTETNSDLLRFTQNQPDGARLWFPCVDHPSDKAQVRFMVEAPEPLIAVANGLEERPPERISRDGVPYQRFRWLEENPVATYLIALAVGEMSRSDQLIGNGILQSNYFPVTTDPNTFQIQDDVIRSAMPAFEELFSPYPFNKYAHLIVFNENVIPGGLEHQTLVLLDGAFLATRDPEDVAALVSHELGHSWFGNLVTPANHQMYWFSEGLASLCERIFLEETGASLAQFARQAERHVALREQFWRRYANDPALASLPRNEFIGRGPYGKGAAVWSMMRMLLGRDGFYAGLKLLLERHAHGNVNNEEIQAAMEEASGVDLALFFEQFVYDRGVAVLRYGCRTRTSQIWGKTQIDCTFRQEQAEYALLQDIWTKRFGLFPEQPFRYLEMPVPLWIGQGDALPLDAQIDRPILTLRAKRKQTFSLCVDEVPQWLSVDPLQESYAIYIEGLEPDDVPFHCTN